ncbi:MAG: hypothetical protein FJ128_03390 [Deltaproteobacteria bacterium]|nr:hypothetical protein [Deltaproteobacteria bacterium]
MSNRLSSQEAEAVCRISNLVIVNAMIFQEILANYDPRVANLQQARDSENIIGTFSSQWKAILEINYYPIFHLARELLQRLPSHGNVVEQLRLLGDAAQRIVGLRAALRHDLMGRVYHKLLADKKYLATYYTRVPSAVLLLKLALGDDAFARRWHDFNDLMNFRIADLACGTGTLLMAAADAVTSNYVNASVQAGEKPNFGDIHRVLSEEIILGYDVLPSAIHLTASTLALRAPEITFEKMNLFNLPMGGKEAYLGSLEFLKGKDLRIRDLFGARVEGRQVGGKNDIELLDVNIPPLDLCVMNPPFTRSVIGNLLFGSFPDKERGKMQTALKNLVKNRQVQTNITAGLAAVFVALADRYVKCGGRLALVLPKALLSGVAWEPTRDLLRKKYEVEYIVASHDPERWNFSESTSLSEILLVAHKREEVNDNNKISNNNLLTCINLWRNPDTAFDALTVYFGLQNNVLPKPIPEAQGALELLVGKKKIAEILTFKWEECKNWPLWLLPCAFAQSDLIRAAYHLLQGRLWLPGFGVKGELPLAPLNAFGSLGPDGRDIHDGFRLSRSKSAYPAFWGTDNQVTLTMAQEPNAYLSPLHRAKKGRPLRRVEDLWPLAGKILLGARLWLFTRRLWGVRLKRQVLSNVWWPLTLKEKFSQELYEKALVVWFNSSLNLILLLAIRQETRGAWVQFKKPVLAGLPVLDLSSLSEDQSNILSTAYDEFSDRPLLTFPEMDRDPVRARIDAAVAEALGLPDFSILREMLAREPVVCLKRL